MGTPMIWFDFGGVLSPPLSEIFTAFEGKTGISPALLQEAMAVVGEDLGLPALAPIELGHMPEAEWAGRLARALADRHPGIDLSRARWDTFGQQWFEGITANAVMVGAARDALADGMRVGILSNNVVEWEPYWSSIVAPVGTVECVVDSCEVGVRKPDPEIFRIAEERARVAAEDCVLIDDLVENCAAAESRGWSSIHFRDNTQALRELSALTGLRFPLPV
jgi:putative hydrolase of the HAD superfamily